jgi:Protein of unknown function (DUF1501)/Haem-degrading
VLAAAFRQETGPAPAKGKPDVILGLRLPATATAGGGKDTTFQGGMPIVINGQVIGALGIDGGAGKRDTDVARAGIDALLKELGTKKLTRVVHTTRRIPLSGHSRHCYTRQTCRPHSGGAHATVIRPMSHVHPIGIRRRELLQVGFSVFAGLGLGASGPRTFATERTNRTPGRPKQVILIFQTGAPSHIDTFDPKPDSPAEIRGEFTAIDTTVPGVKFGEHLPLLAARAHHMAIVRTFSHKDNNHTAATHHLLTGSLQPGVRFDKPLSRDDWPCYAAGVSFCNP